MQKWGISSLLAFILGGFVFGVGAQANTPLMTVVNGTLYALDIQFLPYSACQPDEQVEALPVIAPDHTHFAFTTQPRFVAEAIAREGGIGGGQLPNNLWLCDHASNRLVQVATQPPNPSFFSNGTDEPILRSQPVWSPDGARLAWVELQGDSSYALGIFNLSTLASQTYALTNYPPQYGVPVAPTAYWTSEGIAVYSTSSTDFVTLNEALALYTPEDGAFITLTPITSTSDPAQDFIMERLIASVGGRDYLLVHFSMGGWRLMHLTTGVQIGVSNPVFLTVNKSIGENTLIYDLSDPSNASYITVAAGRTGNGDSFTGFSHERIALSADGYQIAFMDDNVQLWDAGEYGTIEGTQGLRDLFTAGLVWGATNWQVDQNLLLPQCVGALPSALVVGDTAQVVPNSSANNVRSLPSINGALVGQVAPAEPFSVLAGPVCADGRAWYRIANARIIGWTVQGDAASNYIERVP